jgi:surface protein
MPALMGANPPGIFTTKASLRSAVEAYNANPDTATETYGSIAGWDVSMITDMNNLFEDLTNFNVDISSWDTSKVTTMYRMFSGAHAFNQPLSLDTSKVTTMYKMFYVRSARALAPNSLESGLPRACRLIAPPPPHALRPRGPHLAPASHVPLPSTRQNAKAFNQPLSFDTSKVTDMNSMFNVRSERALTPQALSQAFPVHTACAAAAHALPPPGPHLAPHRMCMCPSLRLGSTRTPSTSQ